MSETSGGRALPDMDLSLDFMDLIGKLHRQASIASRSGQMEDLEKIAAELVEWQKRLRRAFVLALGNNDLAVAWGTLVNSVAELRRDRDTAQTLHRMAAEDLQAYDRTFTQQREELERLRQGKTDE